MTRIGTRLGTRLLLAVFPIVLIAMAAIGGAVYLHMKAASSTALERQMTLALEQTAREWRNQLSSLQSNVKLLAGSGLVERYAATEDESERVALLQPGLIRMFSRYQGAYPRYREIRLLMPDGFEDTRVTRLPMSNATDHEGDSAWFDALRTASAAGVPASQLRFGWSRDDGAPELQASRAVQVPQQGLHGVRAQRRVVGYVSVSASVDDFAEAITAQRIGRTGRIVLLDDAHRPIGAGSKLWAAQLRTALQQREQPARNTGGPSSVDGGHRLRIGAQTMLEQSVSLQGGLTAHALMPESEFAAARRSLALSIALIGIVALAVVSALLYTVLRRLIVEPLERLAVAARRLGEGRDAQLLDHRRNDEIGELAIAFDDMREKLGASMSELKSSHDRITELAYTDSLTRLPNRRAFLLLADQHLQQESAPASALMFLDLDGFKRINDTLGHEAGDLLLAAVAERLVSCTHVRKNPSPIARLGGDEFTVLLTDASEADAIEVAERILDALCEPIALGNRDVVIGTSIGIALSPRDAARAAALLKCADVAMYDAKREGPNNWRLYGHAMQEGLERRMELENELRSAVQQRELSLDYQPQYDLSSGDMIGCEALLRWRHPELGFVSPVDFIPVAEAAGLIGDIGEWVLNEACRQWREWDDEGIAPPRIAVNVSQRQFNGANIAATVQRTLATHRLAAGTLELELTESCMMEAQSNVLEALARLRTQGVRVAMDDFGTGYSSLAALTQLPIDTLKIDRSFVTGLQADSPNEKVVSAILSLARGLELEIVAEGVETGDELAFLREHACDIVQGYLFSKPLPVLAMTALLVSEHTVRDAA